MKDSRASCVPPPGSYEDGLNIGKPRHSSGVFVYSDYENVRTTEFGKYSERFERSLSPEQIKNINWKKVNPTSAAGRNLAELARKSVNKHAKAIPGPGSYEIFSEFGMPS